MYYTVYRKLLQFLHWWFGEGIPGTTTSFQTMNFKSKGIRQQSTSRIRYFKSSHFSGTLRCHQLWLAGKCIIYFGDFPIDTPVLFVEIP